MMKMLFNKKEILLSLEALEQKATELEMKEAELLKKEEEIKKDFEEVNVINGQLKAFEKKEKELQSLIDIEQEEVQVLEEKIKTLQEALFAHKEKENSLKEDCALLQKEQAVFKKRSEEIHKEASDKKEAFDNSVISHMEEVEEFQRKYAKFESQKPKEVKEQVKQIETKEQVKQIEVKEKAKPVEDFKEKEAKVVTLSLTEVVLFERLDELKKNIISISNSQSQVKAITKDNDDIYFVFYARGTDNEYEIKMELKEEEYVLSLYEIFKGTSLIEVGYESSEGIVLQTNKKSVEEVAMLLKNALESTTFIKRRLI